LKVECSIKRAIDCYRLFYLLGLCIRHPTVWRRHYVFGLSVRRVRSFIRLSEHILLRDKIMNGFSSLNETYKLQGITINQQA